MIFPFFCQESASILILLHHIFTLIYQTKAARLQELETAGLVASDSFNSFPSLVADTPASHSTRQAARQQEQHELTEGEESVSATRYAQVGRICKEIISNTACLSLFNPFLLSSLAVFVHFALPPCLQSL